MTDKFNGTLRVKGIDTFHLLPVSREEKEKKKGEKRKKKNKQTDKSPLRGAKKGRSIDIIA